MKRIGGAETEQRQPEQKPADQRHSRGAQDEPGQPEVIRSGRASPTPTGCARGHPERPQGQGSPQRWAETPTAAGDALTPSTGAQGRHTLPKVVRGYPLTITRSQPHQTRHRPRQTAQSAEHPPATHRAHRGRTDAPQSAKRGEGHSYPPTAPREPQPPRMTRRGCATHLYEYGSTEQPRTRKPAQRKG